jgi:hypothetical protein
MSARFTESHLPSFQKVIKSYGSDDAYPEPARPGFYECTFDGDHSVEVTLSVIFRKDRKSTLRVLHGMMSNWTEAGIIDVFYGGHGLSTGEWLVGESWKSREPLTPSDLFSTIPSHRNIDFWLNQCFASRFAAGCGCRSNWIMTSTAATAAGVPTFSTTHAVVNVTTSVVIHALSDDVMPGDGRLHLIHCGVWTF